MHPPKFIFGIYAVLFTAVTFTAVTFFFEMHRDLAALQAQEKASKDLLADETNRLRAQEKYLDQLRHDPTLVEHLIRKKLGYARTQEFVFRFEDQK